MGKVFLEPRSWTTGLHTILRLPTGIFRAQDLAQTEPAKAPKSAGKQVAAARHYMKSY